MDEGDVRITRARSAGELRECARCMAATDPWITLGRDHRSCLRSLSGREVYTARSGRAVAGFIVISMSGVLSGYIQTVCVKPEARGRGLGARLIRFAEKRIFARSPNVFLCVSSFNKGARRLYRRLGYSRAGLLKDFIVLGHDEILMRKTIGPRAGFGKRRAS